MRQPKYKLIKHKKSLLNMMLLSGTLLSSSATQIVAHAAVPDQAVAQSGAQSGSSGGTSDSSTLQSPINWTRNTDDQVKAAVASQNKQNDMDNYIVQWGDTLDSIGAAYGTTADAIASKYNIADKNLIYAGYKLGQQGSLNQMVQNGQITSSQIQNSNGSIHVPNTVNSGNIVNAGSSLPDTGAGTGAVSGANSNVASSDASGSGASYDPNTMGSKTKNDSASQSGSTSSVASSSSANSSSNTSSSNTSVASSISSNTTSSSSTNSSSNANSTNSTVNNSATTSQTTTSSSANSGSVSSQTSSSTPVQSSTVSSQPASSVTPTSSSNNVVSSSTNTVQSNSSSTNVVQSNSTVPSSTATSVQSSSTVSSSAAFSQSSQSTSVATKTTYQIIYQDMSGNQIQASTFSDTYQTPANAVGDYGLFSVDNSKSYTQADGTVVKETIAKYEKTTTSHNTNTSQAVSSQTSSSQTSSSSASSSQTSSSASSSAVSSSVQTNYHFYYEDSSTFSDIAQPVNTTITTPGQTLQPGDGIKTIDGYTYDKVVTYQNGNDVGYTYLYKKVQPSSSSSNSATSSSSSNSQSSTTPSSSIPSSSSTSNSTSSVTSSSAPTTIKVPSSPADSADYTGLTLIGDSTGAGWNPYNDGSKSYIDYASKDLTNTETDAVGNTKTHFYTVNNAGVESGKTIAGDMSRLTDQAIANSGFANSKDIVIGLGVNDLNYGDGTNINSVIQTYQDNLAKLHNANPNAKIHILLPLSNFLNGKNNSTIGTNGFSMYDLRDQLTQLGNRMGVDVINTWDIVNDGNHSTTIPDGVHPTNATYQALGQKVADAIKNDDVQWTGNTQNIGINDTGYINTLTGYRWLNSGKVGNGFVQYAGTYYWFDNGVRSDNAWHDAWGHRYYTGPDGRAYEGKQTIDGKQYYFGDDKTYYVRDMPADTTPAAANNTLPNVNYPRSTPATDVVDLSSNNGNVSVQDFVNMRNQGVKAVIVKLTEGTSYRNPLAASQIRNAQAAGLGIGVYHFSQYTDPSGARAEANYFVQFARQLGLNTNTLMINDLEAGGTKTGNVTANSAAFNQALKDNGYNNTGLYTGPSYINSTGLNYTSFIPANRAWIAAYPYTPSASNLKYTDAAMWQWSSSMTFSGVSGQFDVSILYQPGIFNGTVSNNVNYSGSTTTVDTSAPQSIQNFQKGGGKYVLQGSFRVDDIQYVNGMWQIKSEDLAADPFDWSNNGIPTTLVDNVSRPGVRDFNVGEYVKFKSDYQTGYISSYSNSDNAVGINYGGSIGTIWYGADKFWNHS